MNALIYTEESKLIVRKPNGLQYEFDNVDRPELGFDFDVLVYDDIEVKILKWEDNVDFNDLDKSELSDEEKSEIERYIENSEPPLGYNLNTQYIRRLNEIVHNNIQEVSNRYDFNNLTDAVYAGREGSNHPYRSNARRVLEYADTCWKVYSQVASEINQTREDTLKELGEYAHAFPTPNNPPDSTVLTETPFKTELSS